MKPFVSAFLSWLVATAVCATILNNDGLGALFGLVPGVVAYVAVRSEQRRENALGLIRGINAFAENTDPVEGADPTVKGDIERGVSRCLQRGVSEFGLKSYEDFRSNWLHREDITVDNPLVQRGALGVFGMHATSLRDEDYSAIVTAYGLGYAVGMAERADTMHLGPQVARQWQEVLGMVAAVVHQNPPAARRSGVVPLADSHRRMWLLPRQDRHATPWRATRSCNLGC